MNERGSFYVEVLFAIGILSIIGVSLLPVFPRLVSETKNIKINSKIVVLADYIGSYVFRWINFDPLSKQRPLSFYSDGSELELTIDRRINNFLWADPNASKIGGITDFYKASIQFFETSTRVDSAVVRIQVWYDKNENNEFDPGENNIVFSTIITEKGLVF